MNLRDFRILSLYEGKHGHNGALASLNIQNTFGDNTAKNYTIQRWYKKLEDGDLSLENESSGKPKTVINEDASKEIVKNKPQTNFVYLQMT